jgi:adenosylcobinamide kinase / adenosylcobinamide-phosphate guanylyltransferase
MNRGPKSVLILGGARSGKSNFAIQVAHRFKNTLYALTAPTSNADEELLRRFQNQAEKRSISKHKVIEPPSTVEQWMAQCASEQHDLLVLDSWTLFWASEVTESLGKYSSKQVAIHLENELSKTVDNLWTSAQPLVMVSNEVGDGVVPSHSAGRIFRDAMGAANQVLAAKADVVLRLHAGLAQCLKGGVRLLETSMRSMWEAENVEPCFGVSVEKVAHFLAAQKETK